MFGGSFWCQKPGNFENKGVDENIIQKYIGTIQELIHIPQHRNNRRAVVSTLMRLWLPQDAKNFMT
jgi:hypothetical protein